MPLDESCLQSYSDRKANHSNSGRKISKFFGITDNSIDEANHNNNSNNNNNNNNTSDKTSKAIKIFGLNDNEINKKFKSNHRGSSSNNSNEIGGLIIVASIRKHVVCKGYLSKHTNTNFVLSKSWKKRYFILARNILYCFKSSDQTSALVDNFELTSDTIVCVSDAFNGKSWILEVSKLNVKPWYLQADNVNEMKSWLRELKSIVVKLKYRIPKSPSDSANTSTVSINLTDNDENDNNDNISIDDKSVSSINNNKKNKVINGTNNSSNTSVNNIGSNCSITTNAISSLISESHEEDEFFTPKTSVSDRSSILSGTSDDSDEIMQASLLPPPRPIMTSLPPPPRPKSTQPVLLSPSSPTKTSRTFMPSSVPLAPHTMSNIMMIKEEEISEISEISDDDESKQSREFTKRSASPVESLSPPATNNLSPSIIKTTMTLEQRRRSNSFKSLRVNVLSNNNNNNNNSVNNSAQLTKNLADSNDPDKRNRNRQNSPIVMPSWSVRSISTNTMTTPTNTDTTNTASAASNDNNVINDNVSKNTITTPINHHVLSQQTRITTPLSPQNFQNLNSPSKSGNAKITTSSSSSPIGNKKSPINNKGIDFIVSPTDNNNNHDIPSSSTQQQQSPQKTRQRGNKNRTKPKIRLPNDLSASVSSTTSGDDKIQNNGVKSHPQSSSSSSSSLSSSPTMSPSSTVSPSSSLPPPTPPTPFNLLYRNRNYQSSFMDLPVTPVSHSLPARSKSYSNLRKSSMTSLNTFDLSSLPPPTQPPNAPLPPIPQQEPVPQPQAPPQLQKESKAKFSSHTLPSSTSKTISEKLKRSPLKNSKETEDCIDSDRSKQLAASRKNNKKLGKVGKNEIEETTGSHTDRDKIDNGIRKNAINFPVSGLAFVMVEETNGNGETILDLQDINEINNNNNGSNNKGNNNVTIIKTEEIKNP